MFGFFKRKPAAPPDPLASFDAVLGSMTRQGEALRKSAATLLALKAQLSRDDERLRLLRVEVQARLDQTTDEQVAQTLRGDLLSAERRREAVLESRVKVEGDAALLLEAAREHTQRLEALAAERATAKATLSAGLVVSDALKAQVEEIDRVLALDKARDEVERAHALAEIYRAEAR